MHLKAAGIVFSGHMHMLPEAFYFRMTDHGGHLRAMRRSGISPFQLAASLLRSNHNDDAPYTYPSTRAALHYGVMANATRTHLWDNASEAVRII